MPIEHSQGYLVLINDPNVAHWEITISDASYQDNQLVLTKLKSFELWGQNYWKIDSDFLTSATAVLSVTGYNTDGIIIYDDGPIQIDPDRPQYNFQYKCSKLCVGDDYSYTIDLYTQSDGSGPSYMAMEFQAYRLADANGNTYLPFYTYYDAATYNNIKSNYVNGTNILFGKYHNLTKNSIAYNDYIFYPSPTNPQFNPETVIRLDNVSVSDHILDPNGNIVTGTVYGVQKAKGPWAGQSTQTVHLTGGDEYCGNLTFGGFLNFLNTYADPAFVPLTPQLYCDGQSGDAPDVGAGGPSDCETQYFNDVMDLNTLDGDVTSEYWDILNSFLECEDNNGSLGGLSGLPNHTITCLSDTIQMSFNSSTFYNEDSTVNPVTLNLNKGLYMATTVLNGGNVVNAIFEVKNSLQSTVAQKDFVDILIYPNPVTENNFKIQFTPHANLKVKYELYDNTGTLRYQTTYYLTKDKQATPLVKLRGTIPSGMLYNRFIFEDGSVKTIQTIKQ